MPSARRSESCAPSRARWGLVMRWSSNMTPFQKLIANVGQTKHHAISHLASVDVCTAAAKWLGHCDRLQPFSPNHDADGDEAGQWAALGRSWPFPTISHRGRHHQGHQQLSSVQDWFHNHWEVRAALCSRFCLCIIISWAFFSDFFHNLNNKYWFH